jgi:hypothetical protein
MYDEYGEFRGRVLINQHEWQVHYFGALDAKMGPDNDDNFMTPWSNLRMTQTASSTSLSTVLIMLVTFATMKQ